jgi:phosphoglycolate phosphatase
MIKNVLFDLDGTLLDPKVGFVKCIEYALENLGVKTQEDIASFIGPPLHTTLATLLKTEDKNLVNRAIELYREKYDGDGMYENLVYPGIPELLERLKKQNHTLFVATSKPEAFATEILVHFGFDKFFKGIYGSQLTGELTDKGELISYLLQIEKLNPNECIMIGDRRFDLIGAQKNQMRSIGVLWGYGSEKEIVDQKPQFIVKLPHEIEKIVLEN